MLLFCSRGFIKRRRTDDAAHPSPVVKVMRVPMFSCAFCDYTSHLHASVVVHERTHTKEKRYFCSHQGCGYGAARRWQVCVRLLLRLCVAVSVQVPCLRGVWL